MLTGAGGGGVMIMDLDQSDILRLFILYLEKVEHLNEIERGVFGRYFHFLITPMIYEEFVHKL